MIPQEKAKELVNKYLQVYDGRLPIAKQCALMAVAFAKENPLNTDGYNKYLEEVKKEIENL